eukprot:gene16841-8312_t
MYHYKFLFLPGNHAVERFITTPPSITYARKGSEAFFNWTFEITEASVTPNVKNWFQSDAVGNSLGKMIMTQFLNQPVTVLKESFINRTSYVPNAGMIVKNIKLTDEGYIGCSVQYSNGHLHKNVVRLVVTVPPSIGLKLPNKTVVMVDTKSMLSCQFDARPAPTIKWLLDGKEVNGSRYVINTTTIGVFNDTTRIFTTLLINLTKPVDNGVIQCMAILPNDNTTSSVNHVVYYPPQKTMFTTNRAGNIGELGAITVFTCNADGNPTVFYQMYKDGSLLANTTLGVYTINATSFNDQGTYSCVPVNYRGEGQSVALNFTVNVSPRLQEYSGSTVTKLLGLKVSLFCTFFGQPSANITWSRIGGFISSRANITAQTISTSQNFTVTKSELILNSVLKSDDGIYQCLAQNTAGAKAQNITLDVQYAPEFNKSLENNYTLVEEPGKNSSWACIAEGNPVLSINWYVDGVMPGAGYQIMQHSQSLLNGIRLVSTLTMVGITRSKAGLLSCNATNAVGNVQSNSAVFVNYKPSTSLALKAYNEVILGRKIVLVCKFDSQPQSRIHWEKNNIEINDSTHSITTRIVQSNQPELLASLVATSNVLEGSRHHAIECKVRSNPAANITWTKNGSRIQNSSDILIYAEYTNITDRGSTLKSKLVFSSIRKEDYGNYSCIATNIIGSVSSEQHLTVTYKPYIVASSLSIIVTNETQTVKVFCEIQSSPSLTSAYWLLNGQSANAAHRIVSQSNVVTSSKHSRVKLEITITNSSRVDNGVFECHAVNSIGNVSKNTTLIVNYKPLVTQTINSYYIGNEGSAFSLTCQFIAIPASLVHWTFNGTKVMDNAANMKTETSNTTLVDRVTTTTTLSIPRLTRGMHGYYACHARNHQGVVSRTAEITVYYGPEFHGNLTGQLDIMELSNTSFVCQVEGYPAPDIQWKKDGVRIVPGSVQIQEKMVLVSRNKVVRQSVIRFTKVTEQDTASYTCAANNSAATNHTSKRLNVLFLPKLLIQSHNQTVNQSDNVFIECRVAANPPVTRYIWTKDGAPLSEKSSKYNIPSAQGALSGVYTCVGENSLGSSPVLTINFLVNIPPAFTKQAECKANTTTMKMICTCAGTGVPTPIIYWTKGNSDVIIGRGNVYEKQITAPSVNENYKCNLQNFLKKETSLAAFYYNVNRLSTWAVWSSCNATCGDGIQTRDRLCLINPCSKNELIDFKNCTGVCQAWAIALYVLIPIIVVLLVIILLWVARTNRRKEEESPIVVPVYGNLSKPPSTRSVPTKRDIYLPEENFGTINNAYFEVADTPQKETAFFTVNEDEYENKEMEITLDEEYPLESTTDESPEDLETMSPKSSNGVEVEINIDDSQENNALQETAVDSPEDSSVNNNNNSGDVSHPETNDDDVPYSFYNEMVTAL